jgi:hypothetical protein
VGEEAGLVVVYLRQPGRRFGVLAFESLELVHGPPGEVLADAPCEEAQLGAVEGSVVVDPASYLGVDRLGEAGQVRAAAAVEVPGPDLAAFRRRWRAGRLTASAVVYPFFGAVTLSALWGGVFLLAGCPPGRSRRSAAG